MDDKINTIKNILNMQNNTDTWYLMNGLNQNSINNLYELFVNDINFTTTNTNECYFLGYYHKVKNNFELSTKNYKISVKGGCVDAMCGIAGLYNTMKKYDKVVKYYLMAIEHNSVYAMLHLGYYYRNTNDNDNTKKYFLMGVNNGCHDCVNEMVSYYKYREPNKKLANMYKYISLMSPDIAINGTNVVSLESCINFLHNTTHGNIVNNFNSISIMQLSKEDEIKYFQLLKEYTFKDSDNLSVSLRIILKLLKN